MKQAKKLLSVILSIALVLSMVPVSTITAKAAEESVTLDIGDGIIVIDSDGYTQGDEEKVEYTGAYVITGEYTSTSSNITAVTVSAGANLDITIKDLTISATGTNSCAFWIKSAYSSTTDDDGATVESITYTTVNLHLEGTNTLKSGNQRAGLATSMYSTLTIDGDGALYAYGGSSGAGIGGCYATASYSTSLDPDKNPAAGGVIVIYGGYIYAQGGYYAPGIGDGDYSNSSFSTPPTMSTEIYILGGEIYAYTSNSNGTAYTSNSTGVQSTSGIGHGADGTNAGSSFSTTYSGVTGNAVIYTSVIADTSDEENWSGIIFTGTTGVVYGDVTLEDYTLPDGYTLTVAEGASLTVTGTLDVSSGTIYNLGTVSAANVTGDVYCSITFAEDSEIAISKVTFTGTETTSGVVYALAGSDVTIANMTNEEEIAASWLSDTEDITFTYGEETVTFTMPYTNVVLTGYYGDRDTTAPAIEGVEDGASYEGDVTFTVTDENLRSVKVDGVTTTTYTITADDATHTIVATDKAGNVTTVSVTVNKIVEVTTEESTTEVSTTETPTTEASSGNSSSSTSSTTSTTPAVGESVTVGKWIYKVTSKNTLELVGTTYKKTNKSFTSFTIKATLTRGGVTYKITSIAANAFKDYKYLKKVSIGKNVKTIGKNAFYGCTSLTTVKGCKGVTTIKANAFYNCKKLTQVGSKKNTITLAKVKTIGSKAFYGCKSVKKINLTSTALTSIGANAFAKCTSVTTFTEKSKKLKTIGVSAFSGCKKLKSITLKTTKLSKIGKNAIKGVNKKATIKVPKSKLKAYKKKFTSKTGFKSTMTIKK